MVNKWRATTLGDVMELKRGYDLPQKNRAAGDVPVVSSSGVSGFHAEAMVKAPGVVTGRYGTIGQVFFIEHDFWPLNTTLYVRDFKGNDPRFIGYFLQCIDFRAYSDKAAVPGVNRNDLHRAKVNLPPVKEQHAIAEILGTLDDRIDNLRQTNTTLEAMAQALFKSWFVDFDGVPPEEMQESEQGLIPKGWRVGTLADLCELNAAKWTAKKHPPTVRYIDLSSVCANRIETMSELTFHQAPSRARMHLREGDTIIGAVRPGNRAFAYIHAPDETLTGSTGFAVLSPKQPHYASFVYLAAARDETIERLANLADGAAYPAVRPNVVAETPCFIAPDNIIAEFSTVTKPLLERIEQNRQQAITLAALRDTLLPKLMSGTIRLPS